MNPTPPTDGPSDDPSAAVVVVGDEVLSGSVTDLNSVYLCRRLTELGVGVGRVVVVPDHVPTIAHDVAECARQFTHVITTGGVGPTHDDVTMLGIARAFDVPLTRHPRAEAAIRAFYGDNMAPAALAMADLPRGAELIMEETMRFPVVRMENVWIFPGSPHLLTRKFEAVAGRFAALPYTTRRLRLNVSEPEVAPLMAAIQERHPQVAIGSYPQEPGTPFQLLITVRGKDPKAVARAAEELDKRLAGR